MNETEKSQAPAPFAVGDKVRCVQNEGAADYLSVDVVYEITDFSEGYIQVKGGCLLWSPSRFAPAVPYDDPDNNRWLVIGEGAFKTGDFYINEKTGYVERALCDSKPSPVKSRIVTEWQEFPAPAVPFVDRDGKRWLVVDERRPREGDYFIAHTDSGGENNIVLQDGGGDWFGTRRIVVPWVEFPAPESNGQAALDGSADDSARRELALVLQILSGKGGVTGERGSEAVDLALGVMARCENAEAERDRVHAANGRLSASIDTLESERDSLRARVAEMEAAAKQSPERFDYLLTVLEERQATCFMEHDMSKYGELSCDYRRWIHEIQERRAALAGKEPSNG